MEQFVRRVYESVEVTPELKGRGLFIMDSLRAVFPQVVAAMTSERRAVKRRAGVAQSSSSSHHHNGGGPGQQRSLSPDAGTSLGHADYRPAKKAFAPSRTLPLLDLRKAQEEKDMLAGKGSGRSIPGLTPGVNIMDVAARAGGGAGGLGAGGSTHRSAGAFLTGRGGPGAHPAGHADPAIFSFRSADVEQYDVGLPVSPPLSPRERGRRSPLRSRGGMRTAAAGATATAGSGAVVPVPPGVRRDVTAGELRPQAARPKSVREKSARELSTTVPLEHLPNHSGVQVLG